MRTRESDTPDAFHLAFVSGTAPCFSNIVTISGMTTSLLVYVEIPVPTARYILVNGVQNNLTNGYTFTINNGDTIQLKRGPTGTGVPVLRKYNSSGTILDTATSASCLAP